MPINIQRVQTRAMLNACFEVRRNVFVDEQQVPEDLELDSYDTALETVHIVALTDNSIPVGTARLRPYGEGTCKIERVAVVQPLRKTGLGQQLMVFLEQVARDEGYSQAYLNAQIQARGFYDRLGYAAEGTTFIEAGIQHIAMRKLLS